MPWYLESSRRSAAHTRGLCVHTLYVLSLQKCSSASVHQETLHPAPVSYICNLPDSQKLRLPTKQATTIFPSNNNNNN